VGGKFSELETGDSIFLCQRNVRFILAAAILLIDDRNVLKYLSR